MAGEKSRDAEIWAQIAPKIGVEPTRATLDRAGRVVRLNLRGNQLQALPSEIGQLSSLTSLSLRGNQLQALPPEIGQLSNLTELNLVENQLQALPPEIGQLSNLTELNLWGNQLQALPPEIGQLSSLTSLSLGGNQLQALPPEIGQLSNLTELYLWYNELQALPPEIGQLSNLTELDLDGNQLGALPPEIGQLSNLTSLSLGGNQLEALPPEIGQLSNLTELDVGDNPLQRLPYSILELRKLLNIELGKRKQFTWPPPEIVARGSDPVLEYIQELQKEKVDLYEAKLLLVGQGGTGKSALVENLQGKQHIERQTDTTQGIDIIPLENEHPSLSHEKIRLNVWDFGGQEIYHATHQFFLTHRSIYLVVWNARYGADQGNLKYWLDTIKSLAPDSPVLLVATHRDKYAGPLDLNLIEYKEAYPQIVDSVAISNTDGNGIEVLRRRIWELAATRLPQMGEPWPAKWLGVMSALEGMEEHHIDEEDYIGICQRHGVEEDIARGTLGHYLHDLGKIFISLRTRMIN